MKFLSIFLFLLVVSTVVLAQNDNADIEADDTQNDIEPLEDVEPAEDAEIQVNTPVEDNGPEPEEDTPIEDSEPTEDAEPEEDAVLQEDTPIEDSEPVEAVEPVEDAETQVDTPVEDNEPEPEVDTAIEDSEPLNDAEPEENAVPQENTPAEDSEPVEDSEPEPEIPLETETDTEDDTEAVPFPTTEIINGVAARVLNATSDMLSKYQTRFPDSPASSLVADAIAAIGPAELAMEDISGDSTDGGPTEVVYSGILARILNATEKFLEDYQNWLPENAIQESINRATEAIRSVRLAAQERSGDAARPDLDPVPFVFCWITIPYNWGPTSDTASAVFNGVGAQALKETRNILLDYRSAYPDSPISEQVDQATEAIQPVIEAMGVIRDEGPPEVVFNGIAARMLNGTQSTLSLYELQSPDNSTSQLVENAIDAIQPAQVKIEYISGDRTLIYETVQIIAWRPPPYIYYRPRPMPYYWGPSQYHFWNRRPSYNWRPSPFWSGF